MQIQQINSMLSEVREKLVSLDLAEVVESKHQASQHHDYKMGAAKQRLKQLYDKLTMGRSDSNKVKAYGAKR